MMPGILTAVLLASHACLAFCGDLYYGSGPASWTTARDECKKRGGWIVSPRTPGQYHRVNANGWDSFWTGWNNRDNLPYWVDLIGNRLNKYSYIWSSAPTSTNCAKFVSGSGLQEASCGSAHNYICELDALYINRRVVWEEARHICQRYRGWLWTPRTRREFVDGDIYGWKQVGFWFGWNDIEQEGNWIDNFQMPMPMNMWPSGQPDNAGNQDCALMWATSQDLNDIQCDTTQKVICKTGRYYYGTVALNWWDARDFCQAIGAHLFTPLSHDEIISVNVHNWGDFWMGYNDLEQEDKFYNLYGELIPHSYPIWLSGHPNNFGGNQHCVRFHSGKLNDWGCDQAKFFICAREYSY